MTDKKHGGRARTATCIAVVGLLIAAAVVPTGSADEIQELEATLPTPRSDTSAVWDGNRYAYIYGGFVDILERTDQILRFEPATGEVTIMSGRLPYETGGSSAVWTGSHAFVFHGYNGAFALHSPGLDVAVQMPANLPNGAYQSSAIWDGRSAYIFGGTGDDPQDTITRYTPSTGELRTMNAKLPSARTMTAAVYDGDRYAYLFGGIASEGRLNEIVRYDTLADVVAIMSAELPEEVSNPSAVWDGNVALIFGGYVANADEDPKPIVKYDPGANEVTVMDEELPAPGYGTSAIWDGCQAFVFGGGGLGRDVTDAIYRYDITPERPSRPSATLPASLGSVSLSWSPPDEASYSTILQYNIYRATAPSTTPHLVGSVPGSSTSFTDFDPPDGLHTYTVAAETHCGQESDESLPEIVATADL